MLLGYIDESYDEDDYWLTALLVPDIDHASLSKRLREIAGKAATAHGLDTSAEFRGYDVFHGEREWKPLKAAPRQRIGIYKAVLDAVAHAGCRVIVAGAVRAATEKRWPGYHPTEHAHRVAFFGLLTEVAAHCTAKEERAILIADEVSGSSAILLRQDVRRDSVDAKVAAQNRPAAAPVCA